MAQPHYHSTSLHLTPLRAPRNSAISRLELPASEAPREDPRPSCPRQFQGTCAPGQRKSSSRQLTHNASLIHFRHESAPPRRALSSGYRSKILGTLGTNAKAPLNPLSSLNKNVPKKVWGQDFFLGDTGDKLPVFWGQTTQKATHKAHSWLKAGRIPVFSGAAFSLAFAQSHPIIYSIAELNPPAPHTARGCPLCGMHTHA